MGHDFFLSLELLKGSSVFPVGAFRMEICAKWRRSISILGHLGCKFRMDQIHFKRSKLREIHHVLFTGTVDSKNTRFLE